MRRFLIALLLSSLYINVHAQTSVDSLIKELQKAKDDTFKVKLYGKLFESYPENVDEQINYATQMLALCQKLGYPIWTARAYNCLGLAYIGTGRHINTALKNLYTARDLFEQIGDKNDLVGTLCDLGIVYLRVRQSQMAIDTLRKAEKIVLQTNDSSNMASLYYSLGQAYYAQKKYPEALQNFFIAKTVLEKRRREYGLGDVYVQIAWALAMTKKYDDARLFALKALQLGEQLVGDQGHDNVHIIRPNPKKTINQVLTSSANECLAYINRKK